MSDSTQTTDYAYRGPQGKLHLPSFRTDCWRGRPSGMCALCQARMVGAIVRLGVRERLRSGGKRDE